LDLLFFSFLFVVEYNVFHVKCLQIFSSFETLRETIQQTSKLKAELNKKTSKFNANLAEKSKEIHWGAQDVGAFRLGKILGRER
jgi:hypothetical protein